jgi:1-deoxy-D-xylulose-5-phosphate reductoisomerase
MTRRAVSVLGATGSIGASTLDVLRRHPDKFEVFGLSGYTRIDALAELVVQHQPRMVAVPDLPSRDHLLARLRGANLHRLPEVVIGLSGLDQLCSASEVDTVMAAIVGVAGLRSTLAAADAGKTILLANKETLVMGGHLFIERVRHAGASVIPIDSEHNAIFQCLTPCEVQGMPVTPEGVTRIVLTASGGPFRSWSSEQMAKASVEQACAHPKWSMGRKISVDSATLMNKGLEVIEAHYLFGLPASQLDVVVHPQSIIHSMVEYRDGSTLAQMGNPDMRTPIAQALGFPERLESGVGRLDLTAHGRLDFEAPDLDRFPCLKLAQQALAQGGNSACILNAANETTVAMFLDGEIGFADIGRFNGLVLEAMSAQCSPAATSIDELLDLDAQARTRVTELVRRR